MLDVQDLSCSRGDRTLFQSLSFTVAPGNLLSVTGENGSGKTTLLRALCGLSPVDHGRISWQGRDITDLKQSYIEQLAYVGHRNALKDDLNPIENLQAITRVFGHDLAFGAARTALDGVGLGRVFHMLATKLLSEGQKRRVALARLWFCNRPLWVLDEPFTALDAHSSQLLRERMQQHLENRGLVVVATHEDVRIQYSAVHQLRLAG
jgi:heme exporter protein A